MRKSWWLVALLLLSESGCKGPSFVPVDPARIDGLERDRAQQFATDTLRAWSTDVYPPLQLAADPEFQASQSDVAKQRAADRAVEAQFGDFERLAFVEAYRTNPPQHLLYRFRSKFSKSPEAIEVRVVFDTQGRLSGFWVKRWLDAPSP